MPPLTLKIYFENNKTPYHITICYVNSQQIIQDVINNYARKYFGRSKEFVLTFDKFWGQNSILTKSYNPMINVGLEDIRKEIISFINNKYPKSIDTSRYADGLPPQHIDIKGDLNSLAITFNLPVAGVFGKSVIVTYSI
jgi:hypothetical protein